MVNERYIHYYLMGLKDKNGVVFMALAPFSTHIFLVVSLCDDDDDVLVLTEQGMSKGSDSKY